MPSPRHRTHNRLHAIMSHIGYLTFKGKTRLAREAGVSHSVVCRIISGQSSPSFAVIAAITQALERRLGRQIDPRDIINFDGNYPTPSVCTLCACPGCLPDEAYTKDDVLKPHYREVRSGEWHYDVVSPPAEGSSDTT